MITEDNSMEFDMYEDARRHLTEFLVSEGKNDLEAERIALYMVQGLRGVPKFLSMLKQSQQPPSEQVRAAFYAVLDNAASLEKARSLLLKSSDEAT